MTRKPRKKGAIQKLKKSEVACSKEQENEHELLPWPNVATAGIGPDRRSECDY
jgi:hypothetical protein